MDGLYSRLEKIKREKSGEPEPPKPPIKISTDTKNFLKKGVIYGTAAVGLAVGASHVVDAASEKLAEINQAIVEAGKRPVPVPTVSKTHVPSSSQNDKARQDSLARKASEESLFQQEIARQKNSPDYMSQGDPELDKQKDWLLEKMNDPVYAERAENKEHLSVDDIEKRKSRVEKAPILYFDNEFIKKTPLGTTDALTCRIGDNELVLASVNAPDLKKSNPTIVHEETHVSTAGDAKMSEYAKNLYRQAFRGMEELVAQNAFGSQWHPTQNLGQAMEDHYLSSPTELDARKKVFEYDLEKMGIKKYGEPFTKEILYEAMSRFLQLSEDSREFIMHIKPEYMERIMNTIADNDRLPDGSVDYKKALEKYGTQTTDESGQA